MITTDIILIGANNPHETL